MESSFFTSKKFLNNSAIFFLLLLNSHTHLNRCNAINEAYTSITKKNVRMHRLLIISRPRILFENNSTPFPLYRGYVFPSPQTRSFRFIFLVPGCFPLLRLFIFLLAPSPCFLSSLVPPLPSVPLFPSSVPTWPPHLLRYLSQFFSPPILIPPLLLRA